jgi:hypothetical protein
VPKNLETYKIEDCEYEMDNITLELNRSLGKVEHAEAEHLKVQKSTR